MQFGKLEKVNLRDAWRHEAFDFTNWLAESESLSLLSEEIGINISLIQTEANVGRFSVDILAEEEQTGRKIIIENQLETTDHDHLGKIITYASGLNAEIIIWIVREVRDEHKQAVDWLNEHTDEKINFFVIKMELWQIGGSPYAPKFYIASQPNDWAKVVKQTSIQPSKVSEIKLAQLELWQKLRDFAQEKESTLRLRKPNPQHWYDISIGISDAHLTLTASPQLNLIGCEVYVPDSKDLFFGLETQKQEIEEELGFSLEWAELPNRKASRIKALRNVDVMDTTQWNDYLSWFIEKAENFQRVFPKYIKNTKS